MSRIATFDLSLSATGWAIADSGKVLSHGLITGKFEEVPRLIYIRNRVCEKIDAEKPDLVVFEGLAMRSMDGKALDRTGLAYMIRAELVTDKTQWMEVSPQSLKKFVVGRGGSKKNPVPKTLVVKYIATRFKHANVDDDNICDAIGLAYIAMALLGEWKIEIEAQEEVLQTLRKNNPGIGRTMTLVEPQPTGDLW